MKKKFIAKVVAVLMAFVMLFSLCLFTVANVTNDVPVAQAASQSKKEKRKTYTEALEEVRDRLPEESKGFWRDGIKELKKAKSYEKLGVSLIESGFEFFEDPKNADYTELGMNVVKSGVNVLLACFGLPGGISDAFFDGIMNFGDNPQSELQILQGHLDDQFDEVHDHLDDIQSDIADLSNQVDDSTKKILEALSNALEADYAKAQVIDFMSSSEGNFNYTQFKNYLYGKTNGNDNPYYYTQAHYNKLVESIVDNSSEEIIKENYNTLYRSLASTAQRGDTNINMLYDYLLHNELSGKESIQRYYYEYLLSNRELLGDRNAEYEALQFTLDLYKTALFADHCIAMCNNYQLMCIYEMYGTSPSADVKYRYGSGENDYITYGELLQNSAAIDCRQADLEVQMVSDVAYILNMEGSVYIEDDNHDMRVMSDSDETTFGSVQVNQTIYLNKMFDEICTVFGFESDSFTYEWYSNNQLIGVNDGVFKVNGFYSSFEGVIKYNGEKIYSVPFEITEGATFNGGDGSEEDPYVISNAEQFNLIATTEDGLNKHYILIDDIDFDDVSFAPIGNEDKPFTGSLDGNGYSIKNLAVSAGEYVGLFGCVEGKVENLNVEKSTFSINSGNFERVYAGAIAAYNIGEIKNCYVIDSSVSIQETSNLLNKHLYTYAGGIAGKSEGSISYCKIENTGISTSLVRDYGSEKDGSNTTNAYAAGVVAAIAENGTVTSCYVNNKTKVSASATSTCNDGFSTRHPYISVRAAGVVASFTDIKKIDDVWSDAVINMCKYQRENTALTGFSDTNNCSAKYDQYIPGISNEQKTAIKAEKQEAIVFPNQSLDYEITYSFKGEFNEKYNCYEDQLYYCNEKTFKVDNLNILINGEAVEYSIVSYYNFTTFNSDVSQSKTNPVTIVFISQYKDESIVDRLQLPITITENSACGLEMSVLPNKTTYNKDETVSIAGGSVVLRYQDGSTKDVTYAVELSYDTSKYGKTQVTVSYGGFATTYDIIVDCTHSYKGTTVNPTCTTIGYTVYTCEHCSDTYKTDFTSKVAHTTVAQNIIPATCTEEGKIADLFCTVCREVVEIGEVIPPTGHNYAEGTADAGAHYCKFCKECEEHLFRTTEYETEVLCTCVICDYVAKFGANSREKISKLPRVVVSDAYSLSGENEIVVYVELYSDVGITSANFSVYFGDELELVSYSLGNILYKPSVSAFEECSDHLNLILAQANTEMANPNYEESNTLLKLVFRTPEDATIGKEYPIYVVNKAENNNGTTKFIDKFTSSKGEPLDFISLKGKIKVVDRLPGDVVGDGVIDLLDAVIISKYFVLEGDKRITFLEEMKNQYDKFDISYGDVTLDNLLTVDDVVQILRYIVGGYEARILAKEFNIKLNHNDGTGNESNISAHYNENGEIILNGIPVIERDGYRFDGWYYGFSKDADKMDGKYEWNYGAIEQTLYAHYTLNSITFVGNGATSGNMDDITYGEMDEWTVNNEFNKISNVYFDSRYSDDLSERISLNHTFKGWALSPDSEIVYRVGQVINLKDDEIGNLTLYAIWSTEYVTLPSLERTGYKLSAWTSDMRGFSVIGNANSKYPITSDTTVYAQWNLIKYIINYDGNGHTSGNTSDVNGRLHSAETSYQLAPNGYLRTGYHFVGWNTKADGSGRPFDDKETVSYIDTERDNAVTLYAQWEENTYDIVFNINNPSFTNSSNYKGKTSGTMSDIKGCLYDTDVVLTKNSFVVEGWNFKGWATSETGDVLYQNGSTQRNLSLEGKVNLYAVWEVNPYTVGNYVSNGVVVSDTDGGNSYTVYNDINTTTPLKCGEKVILGTGITSIPDSAFEGCSSLQIIILYEKLVNIGANAFKGCEVLKFEIPNTVKSIGNSAFDGCKAMQEVTITEMVTSLGTGVFNNCGKLVLTVNSGSLTIVQAALNSGATSVYVNWKKSVTPVIANRTLTIPTIEEFRFNGRNQTFENLRIVSNSKYTVVEHVTLRNNMGDHALVFSSTDVLLESIDVLSNKRALVLSAKSVEMTIDSTVSLVAQYGSAGITANGLNISSGSSNTATLIVRGGDSLIGALGGSGSGMIINGDIKVRGHVTLKVTGGNGRNGSRGDDVTGAKAGDGGNGTNGGVAIQATNIYVYDTAVLKAEGGKGGTGGDGGNGSSHIFKGAGDGGHGGKGGDGGIAIVSNKIFIYNMGAVSAIGGNGGLGGNGGTGENNGFDKGESGNGGSGGNGATAHSSEIICESNKESTFTSGVGGKGGTGRSYGSDGSPSKPVVETFIEG